MDRVLPNEDADVSKEIAKQYKKLGVKLLTGYKTTAIRDNGTLVEVDVESKDGSKSETLKVDRVMVSIGFARAWRATAWKDWREAHRPWCH